MPQTFLSTVARSPLPEGVITTSTLAPLCQVVVSPSTSFLASPIFIPAADVLALFATTTKASDCCACTGQFRFTFQHAKPTARSSSHAAFLSFIPFLRSEGEGQLRATQFNRLMKDGKNLVAARIRTEVLPV